MTTALKWRWYHNQNSQRLSSKRLLSPFLQQGAQKFMGNKRKRKKMALYLTALCHAQLLTPEEAVEVINTFKGGTLCSLWHNWRGTMGAGWNPGLCLKRTGRGAEARNAEVMGFFGLLFCFILFFPSVLIWRSLPNPGFLLFVKMIRIADNEQKERQLILYEVKMQTHPKFKPREKTRP